jgi:hypothetical protein
VLSEGFVIDTKADPEIIASSHLFHYTVSLEKHSQFANLRVSNGGTARGVRSAEERRYTYWYP